jgi:hypothetical protein
VHGSLARAVGVFARLNRYKPQRLSALLVDLRENLVSFARGRVVFGELNRAVTRGIRVRLAFRQTGGPGRGLGRGRVLLCVP